MSKHTTADLLLLSLLLAATGCRSTGSIADKRDTLNLKSCKEQGFDKGDTPNEAGVAIFAKLDDEATSLETISGYFSHYSPVIRHKASQALSKRGKEGMPLLIKALQSGDKYRVRAACDAMSQIRGFFGITVKTNRHKPQPMTPENNAEAVPYLVPLLDHEDMYVRAGVLQALSRCGKAAAPHLPKVATFITDDEWWLRSGAAYVLLGVGSPEADPYLPSLAAALLKERHIQCLNIMSVTLKDLIQTSENREQLAELIGKDLGDMHHAYHRMRGRDVLDAAGVDAKIALPYIEALIAEKEKSIKKAESEGKEAKGDQNELVQLNKTRDKLMGTKEKR